MFGWLDLGILWEIGEAIGNTKGQIGEKKPRVNHFEASYERRLRDPIRIILPPHSAGKGKGEWTVIDGEYEVIDKEEKDG
jgi:hypothetical protein